MVYEFKSTDPCVPRNCQIRLPLLTEENFGIEEWTISLGMPERRNTLDRGMDHQPWNARKEESVGYSSQVVPSGTRYPDTNIFQWTMAYAFMSTDPGDPRNCQIRLPLLTEEKFGIEESSSNRHLNRNISGMQER
ncbi:Hypothetical predicted protein [Mytilus galloprovincialis]|uniref:Uncharacterized protein n=1 Tax=Mytilus galloprovincialis TaxID=29158 RepID=A0A8B6DES4_MYTGA|nr:Hypothetical predicted protein [Mytilus galloprovincialis]